MAKDKAESPQSLQDDEPLTAAILSAAKQACAEETRWSANNPFYPGRDDLTGVVLLKLLTCVPQLTDIWSDPNRETGGSVGLLRFTRTVAKHAAIDEKRRNETDTRAPEILAVRLDAPIRDGDGEMGTVADTIPDSDGLQPFQFEDLRGELTDEEFSVLQGRVQGATQAEIAEETGESKSQIARTYKSAKAKARTWVKGLRTAPYHRTRSHLCARFTRNRCTRPDRLRGAELEAWNPANSRNIVEFHDESAQWRPAITNKPRVRADRECYNLACTHGGAVGPDNLILPSSLSTSGQCGDFRTAEKQSCDFRTMHGVTWLQPRMEAVRFLPAITGKVSQFCEECEKAKQRAEKQVTPTARNSERIFMIHEPKEQSTLTRSEVVRFVRDNELVKQDLAAIANVPAARLSDYLHDKPVSEEYADRIQNAVANIIYVWRTFAPIKIALDDSQAFWKAVELADKTHAAQSVWERFEAGRRMKQEHNEAAAD